MAKIIWISGDTHFGEAQAISLFQRPFSDAGAMDANLIDAMNRSIQKRDVLIHIGDFCGPFAEGRGAQVEHAERIRKQIRCKTIRLIRGNHDPKGARFRSLFESVLDLTSFRPKEGGDRVVLSHYPLRSSRGQLRGSMHLYGHTHGAIEETGRSMDVGVDCWNYSPLRLEHAMKLLAERPVLPPGGWIRRQEMRQDFGTGQDDLPDAGIR